MSTLSSVLFVACSYFVCGFCLDLGFPDSLMKTLRDHAQRQLSRRFDQQKQLWHTDPPLADIVHLTEVRSSGANETGDFTLEVSFLHAADFTWILFNKSNTTFTKGKEDYSGVIRTTTSIDLNVNDSIGFIMLFLQTPSYSILLYFDRKNITHAGVQSASNYFMVLDVPETADVDENGDISLDVVLPSNYTNVTQHLHFSYSYINVETEKLEHKSQPYEVSPTSGTDTLRITIRNATSGGYLTLSIMDIDDLDTVSNTNFSRMFVMKMIDIPDNRVGYGKDIVNFKYTAPPATYHVTDDGYIRYGSVSCGVYGHPKPTLKISKDGQVLKSINISRMKFSVSAYVPLDGKTKAGAAGVYNCTATSGRKTITKSITMLE